MKSYSNLDTVEHSEMQKCLYCLKDYVPDNFLESGVQHCIKETKTPAPKDFTLQWGWD